MKLARVLIALVLTLGLVILVACDSSTSKAPPGTSLESLTLGTSKLDLSSLIWVAKERGYFAEQGLDINFKLYESGHLAIKDLLAGHLDLATATEFAAIRGFMERPDLRIISVLDRAEDQQLVARKDHGIAQVSDLRGKRIGLARNSSSEYYLHVMLILQEIPFQDVQVMDLLPSEQVKAIVKGEIDAVMVWQPFATTVKKELGANAESWSGQSGQEDYWLLLGTEEVIGKRSRAIRSFLAALASAEDFIRNNDAEARRIMANELGDRHEDSLWRNHKFRLGLARPLLLKMEAEITWINSTQGAQKLKMPDLADMIYFDGLNSVRPEKVKILH